MKKLVLSLLMVSTLVLSGCIQDDDTPIIIEVGGGNTNPIENTIDISGAISENTTWTNDKIYMSSKDLP